MSKKKLVQSWNSRSKFWVLIDVSKKGGIVDMQREKFEGVPVKNGKEGSSEAQEVESDNKGGSNKTGAKGSSEDSGWFW